MSVALQELIKELNDLWNASEDKRYAGEHPKCADVLDQIESLFSNMTDEEIKDVLDGLAETQKEQLLAVFEDLVDDKPFLHSYI